MLDDGESGFAETLVAATMMSSDRGRPAIEHIEARPDSSDRTTAI